MSLGQGTLGYSTVVIAVRGKPCFAEVVQSLNETQHNTSTHHHGPFEDNTTSITNTNMMGEETM